MKSLLPFVRIPQRWITQKISRGLGRADEAIRLSGNLF